MEDEDTTDIDRKLIFNDLWRVATLALRLGQTDIANRISILARELDPVREKDKPEQDDN